MAYLATWKQDCSRKTHLCPHTGTMIIKDVVIVNLYKKINNF